MIDLEAIQNRLWEYYADTYPAIANDLRAQMALPGCPICGGLGTITVNVAINHPAFGQSFHCLCRRRWAIARRIESTITSDTIPDDSARFDFSHFDGLDYAATALLYARMLAGYGRIELDDDIVKYGVVLMGPTGCGKTTLTSIVYRHMVAEGHSAGWWNAAALVKRVQSTYASNYEGPGYEEIVNHVSRLDVLVLDDLGSPTRASIYSEDHIEILLKVLNYREAKKLVTMISSNLNPDQLHVQFGPRIYSRINGLCEIVPMLGQDFRVRRGALGAVRA